MMQPLYLPPDVVRACLPDVDSRLSLAERALLAVGNGRTHFRSSPTLAPRPGALAQAGVVHVRTSDVLAMQVACRVVTNPANGLALTQGELLLRDPATGVLTAVLDGPAVHEHAMAATAGVLVRRWAPTAWLRVAVLGCGALAAAAVDVLLTLNPYATVVAYDTDRSRAEALPGVTYIADSVDQAVLGAEVVITASPFGGELGDGLRARALPAQCLLIALDGDSVVRPAVIKRADLFVTDDLDGYNAQRKHGALTKWPKVHGDIGQRMQRDGRPDVVVAMVFGQAAVSATLADATVARARETSAGQLLGS